MLSFALLPLLVAPQAPVDDALVRDLAAAVDLPTPDARARAATALARRSGVTLDQWLAACRAFAPGTAPERKGQHDEHADLQVLDAVESTDLYLYVPRGDHQGPRPMMVWGHGAGGSGAREYLPWQPLADQLGIVVLAPTETDKATAGYAFSERERAALLAAVRWGRRQVDVDENALFLGGTSRGGHLAWDVALRHPDLWAGLAPCIGGPRLQQGKSNNLRFVEQIAHLPIRDLQGQDDDPLLLANLRLAFQLLARFGEGDRQFVEQPGFGHSYDLTAVDWKPFLGRRRDPLRRQVVAMATRPDEGRSAWLQLVDLDPKIAQEQFQVVVDPKAWSKLADEGARRAYVNQLHVDHTARAGATMTAPGRFAIESRGVKKVRLLLTADMLPADAEKGGRVEVAFLGKTHKKPCKPSVAVLLAEFVERFDRTFLPVAEVVVP